MIAGSGSTPLSRRSLLFAGLLLGGVALSEGLRFAQSANDAIVDVEALTPEAIGTWRRIAGPEMILPQESVGSRFYEQAVTRVYGGEGLPLVMLAIAYGSRQDDRLEVHRPEACYPAQGFELAGGRSIELDLGQDKAIPARYLLARRHDRTEQIIYWTRVGELFPRTSVEQKLAVLRSSLALQIPDGILVRISTLGAKPEDISVMATFARLLLNSSPSLLRRAMAGPLSSALPFERA
jgi:EpsI family protein